MSEAGTDVYETFQVSTTEHLAVGTTAPPRSWHMGDQNLSGER
jgi:hypothetical protein